MQAQRLWWATKGIRHDSKTCKEGKVRKFMSSERLEQYFPQVGNLLGKLLRPTRRAKPSPANRPLPAPRPAPRAFPHADMFSPTNSASLAIRKNPR